MPTFINLPPPYSEQPSPMYDLCASSISSNSNFCEPHLSNLSTAPAVTVTSNSPCCLYHHHVCQETGSSLAGSGSDSQQQYTHRPFHENSANTGINLEDKQETETETEERDCNTTTTDTESTSAF